MPGNVGSALFSSSGVTGGGSNVNLSLGQNGPGTSLSTIKLTVGGLFLLAILGLVLLQKAGFRFSVTVGG
jgi:hypothetical protein